MSTIVLDNHRTSCRLLLHLAHDISEQKKTEELSCKMHLRHEICRNELKEGLHA